MSKKELACLVTGDNAVSLDVALRCSVCDEASTEAWFIVVCDGDIFAPAPVVRLDRYLVNRQEMPLASGDQFEHLLRQAKAAHDLGLGAGSMVYLRRIFEDITLQVADAAQIPITRPSGRRVPFRELLQSVNEVHQIIPAGLASNEYQLFKELSEVIHGAVGERRALEKYAPCRQLVLSVVENVKNDRAIAQAIDSLGWNSARIEAIVNEGGSGE